MYGDTKNAEHEMYDYTGHKWSDRNVNKRFKESSKSHTRKTLNTFIQKTAILETSHIIRKVLQLSGGDRRWFNRSSNREKRPVTRDNNDNTIIVIM